MRNLRINLKAVSISLGIILWLYVNLVIPPLVRRTVKANIEFKNIPARIRILPQTNETEIVLTGTRRDFIFAGKDSVQTSVDLYTLRPGPAFFPIKVTTPSGLSVVAMRPAQVEVTGETLVTRKMEIAVDIKGQVAEGFLSEAPVSSPTHVLIEGPRDLVEKATTCQVSLAVGDFNNSISETRKVTVFGPDGEIAQGLRVIPEKANISIAVKSGYPSRMVPIAPQFINKTPEGFKLESFAFAPSEIMLSGPQRVLDQFPNIRTLPVDLSALNSASSTLIALIDSPAFENVKIIGSNTVSLSISLIQIPINKTFSGLPLTLKNAPTQHCSVSPASYTLVLKGFAEDLNKIALADLTIVFDTREMNPGTYSVPLPCPTGLPKKLEVIEILPPKASIVVSAFDPSPVASETKPGN